MLEHIYKILNEVPIELLFSKSKWRIKGYSVCSKGTDLYFSQFLEVFRKTSNMPEFPRYWLVWFILPLKKIVQWFLIAFFPSCLNKVLVIYLISVLRTIVKLILLSKTKCRLPVEFRLIIMISAISVLYVLMCISVKKKKVYVTMEKP